MRIYHGKELTDKLGETRGFKIPFTDFYIVGKVTELNMQGKITIGQYVTMVNDAFMREREKYLFYEACRIAREVS